MRCILFSDVKSKTKYIVFWTFHNFVHQDTALLDLIVELHGNDFQSRYNSYPWIDHRRHGKSLKEERYHMFMKIIITWGHTKMLAPTTGKAFFTISLKFIFSRFCRFLQSGCWTTCLFCWTWYFRGNQCFSTTLYFSRN